MLSSALRRAVLPAALALATVLGATATVSAAPRPITFEVFIGDYCVQGRAKNSSFLKVVIRDRYGNQKGRDAVEADSQGYWFTCVYNGAAPLMPGDKVDVTVFDTGQKRSFTVPVLTAKIDRVGNVVSGKAPAGTKVQLEAFDFRWDHWGESYDVIRDLVATDGTYAHDFDSDGVDLKGGARVVIRWRNGGDTVGVGRFQMVPFVTFQLGRSDVAGAAAPNGHIAITLRDGSGTRLAQAHGVGSYGDTIYLGTFADADGEPYPVRGGEYFNAPALGGQSSWRIPQINSATDLAADKVAANCFANGRYVVLVQNPNGFEFGVAEGNAKASGRLEVDLTGQVDIRRGYRVVVLCYSPGGDEIVSEGSAR